jgi:hypothetical protein
MECGVDHGIECGPCGAREYCEERDYTCQPTCIGAACDEDDAGVD